MAPVPTLRGDAVILTGHKPEEAAAHAAGEDEETARRFGWWPQRSTEQDVLAAYERWAAQWREGGPRRAFATRDATIGALVGGCELRINPAGAGEVSYWTHADQRGNGYAKQALALLCEYAATVGVTRLEAHVAVDNHASRHVAESAGFTESHTITAEGELRIRYIKNLGPADCQPAVLPCPRGPSWPPLGSRRRRSSRMTEDIPHSDVDYLPLSSKACPTCDGCARRCWGGLPHPRHPETEPTGLSVGKLTSLKPPRRTDNSKKIVVGGGAGGV
jgi:RimJ/RimL family protein N-acetyltransferase